MIGLRGVKRIAKRCIECVVKSPTIGGSTCDLSASTTSWSPFLPSLFFSARSDCYKPLFKSHLV